MFETRLHNKSEPATHPLAVNRVFGRGAIHAGWAIFSFLCRGKLDYVVGRFYICRKLYRIFKMFRQYLGFKSIPLLPTDREVGLFTSLQIDHAARSLKINGLYTGLQLPNEFTTLIKQFAQDNLCIRWLLGDPPEDSFLIEQVIQGYLPDGRAVSCADVLYPSSCPAIVQVAQDPTILSLFRALKGYPPTSCTVRLFWYMGLEAFHPATSLLPNMGGLYHYDVPGFDSMYVIFYITDVDRNCGAHVVIEGSHIKKTLPMLFGNRYRSDEYIRQNYDSHLVTIIEQKSGFGFVEDPYCIHKFCTPLRDNRLALQVQYS